MDNGSLFGPDDSQRGSADVEVFTFPATGQQIRIIGTAENPLFCHADVCRGLDHSNPSVALALVDDDDRVQVDARETDIPNLNRDKIINPMMWFLTESGFYDLALASKAPGAKAFKRWITHNVLPTLRKTGSYGLVPKQFDPTDLDHVVQLAQIAADQKRQIEAQGEKIAELTPGYELAETYAGAGGTMTIRTFARTVQQWAQPRDIKVLQEHVFDFLGMIGMVIRSNTSEKGQATATALKAGWCENSTTDYTTHTRGTLLTTYARLTPKGVNHAWKRIHQAIGEFGTLDPKVINP
ncbi:prophage antirepressor-like protein [Streptosporangium album]|uniref:Prophage antirepressor-like protein n=1 Tax=Streptosporangium album TaxID=47479 RepID=A0A7W7RYS8_9ACTN|nr:BRO family protein [Streptosporangium album]MBB4940735.1 prophage antirepressor-like protein [Streptosporangium album]